VSHARPDRPIRLYRDALSGHSHRAELFLSLLGLPCEWVNVALKAAEHKRPEFLRINPFGQLPAIDDDGTIVVDSNAILVYLARRYGDSHWLPEDPEGAAAVQRWLSVAAGQLASGPAAARLVNVFGAKLDRERAVGIAERLFGLMETHLADRQYLVGERPTLADVANYTYTARAPEGSISLVPYPNLRAWLERIEALPGFVPMTQTSVGVAG
jgi:glutathione S-transferase